MLFKNQLYFLFKVIIISALLSFFIKDGLDDWFITDNQPYIALIFILSPVLTLLMIFLIRQRKFS